MDEIGAGAGPPRETPDAEATLGAGTEGAPTLPIETGAGTGDGADLGEAGALANGFGILKGMGEALGAGVGEGARLGVGEGVGRGEGVGDGRLEGVGLGDGRGVGLGLALGVGAALLGVGLAGVGFGLGLLARLGEGEGGVGRFLGSRLPAFLELCSAFRLDLIFFLVLG